MNRRMMLMSTQEKIATALAAMKVRVRFNSPAGPMIDVVNKVMRLPPLPEKVERDDEVVLRSSNVHEVGHVVAESRPWPPKLVKDPIWKELAFLIEDCRSDKLMGEKYIGTRDDRREGYKIIEPKLVDDNFLKSALHVLYEVGHGHGDLEPALVKWSAKLDPLQGMMMEKLVRDVLVKFIPEVQGMRAWDQMIDVSKRARDAVVAWLQQNMPNSGDGSGSGEPQDGDSDDEQESDGEPSKGRKSKSGKGGKSKGKPPKQSKGDEDEQDDAEGDESDEDESDEDEGDEKDDGDEKDGKGDKGKGDKGGKGKNKPSKGKGDEDDADGSGDDESDDGDSGDGDEDGDEDGEDSESDDGDENKDGKDGKDGKSKGKGGKDEKDEGDGEGDDGDESDENGEGDEKDEGGKGGKGKGGDESDESGKPQLPAQGGPGGGTSPEDAEKAGADMLNGFKGVGQAESELIEKLAHDPGFLYSYRAYTENDKIEEIRPEMGRKHVYLIEGGAPKNIEMSADDFKANVKSKIGVLQQKLMMDLRTRRRIWVKDRDRGTVDDTRLSRVGVDDKRVFKRKLARPELNLAVTLLMDMSGSMSGTPQFLCGQMAYILAETLTRLDVPFEVLGFTTGNSYGRTPASCQGLDRTTPLRLVVIKEFSDTNPRSMLGKCFASATWGGGASTIQGEPLMWAANRLAQRPEERKMLIDICDGQPCGCGGDNQQKIVAHCKWAVERIEGAGIETIGIGICTDAPKAFHKRTVVYNDVNDLLTHFYPAFGRILRGEKARQDAQAVTA